MNITTKAVPQVDDATIELTLHQVLLNGLEVANAWRRGKLPPPLRTRAGVVIYHQWPADPIFLLFLEIFVKNCYTTDRFYEPSEGDTIIDCGANIGVFALYLANKSRSVRIHCFEPSMPSFNQLRLNVEANDLTRVISIHRDGLWTDRSEQILLGYDCSARRSLYFDNREQVNQPSEKINCITLKDAIDRCGSAMVDLLKIDTEGAELEIVEGTDAVSWRRVRKVVMEYHEELRPGSKARLITHLTSHGFDQITILEDLASSPNSIGIIQATRT